MAYDMTADNTTTNLSNANDHFTSFPPSSTFDRDRLRLQRELDRDLDHPSFSESSVSGLENVGQPYQAHLDLDDTTNGTFDIDNDARATSTRRIDMKIPPAYNPNYRRSTQENMLQSSPAVNSRILAAEFADFSMAGNEDVMGEEVVEYTNELEVARGAREKNLSAQSAAGNGYSPKVPFAMRGGGATRAGGVGSSLRQQRNAVKDSGAGGRYQYLQPPQGGGRRLVSTATAPRGAPVREKDRLVEEDTFDLNANKNRRPTQQQQQAARHPSETGGKPKKTTEQVSNRDRPGRGTGTANTASARRQQQQPIVEEEQSSLASLEDIIPPKTRKVSKPVPSGRGVNLRSGMKSSDARDAPRKAPAATATGTEVPRSFKTTSVFIHEMGLEGHTVTLDLQNPPTYDETLELTGQASVRSFVIPSTAGVSGLIASEATRIYNSTVGRRRNRNAHSHRPIESIPVPEDNREILIAMQILQDKMAGLEEAKLVTERRCDNLKEELKKVRENYENEFKRAWSAEDEVARRRREERRRTSNNAAANAQDTESLKERQEEMERGKMLWLVEKMSEFT